MDPTATYRAMRDRSASSGERTESALHLLGWLATGGFPPEGVARHIAAAEAQAIVFATLDNCGGFDA